MEFITSENVLLICSVLLIAGVLLGKLSYRMGLPLLLVFLLVGMAFGVDGAGIRFNNMHVAQFIGMIALNIILFSGGLDTNYKSIKPVILPGLVLSTVGVLLTALFTGLFVWWLSGMSRTNIHFALLPSLLLAATMSSTDSASVFGILGSQKVRLKENLKPMLELESGSNDPMAYMFTILLIETISLGGQLTAGTVLLQLALQFVVGGAIGFAMGKGIQWLLLKYRGISTGKKATEDAEQASSMMAIMTLGVAFLTFAVADMLEGNGYLAVYICGIVLGNSKRGIPTRRISKFISSMSWLSQIVVFLMLGLLVNPKEMLGVSAVAIIIGVFMIVAGRPISVMLCLLPFRKISMKARMYVSWVGLRGAVPIIFATYPVVADIPGADAIFNIVFFVTLISLLVQGTTVVGAARKLGLTEPPSATDVDFGIEVDDTVPTTLEALHVKQEMLVNGNTLGSMQLPQGSLVVMIRRGTQQIVPNGTIAIMPDDILLLMKQDEQ